MRASRVLCGKVWSQNYLFWTLPSFSSCGNAALMEIRQHRRGAHNGLLFIYSMQNSYKSVASGNILTFSYIGCSKPGVYNSRPFERFSAARYSQGEKKKKITILTRCLPLAALRTLPHCFLIYSLLLWK